MDNEDKFFNGNESKNIFSKEKFEFLTPDHLKEHVGKKFIEINYSISPEIGKLAEEESKNLKEASTIYQDSKQLMEDLKTIPENQDRLNKIASVMEDISKKTTNSEHILTGYNTVINQVENIGDPNFTKDVKDIAELEFKKDQARKAIASKLFRIAPNATAQEKASILREVMDLAMNAGISNEVVAKAADIANEISKENPALLAQALNVAQLELIAKEQEEREAAKRCNIALDNHINDFVNGKKLDDKGHESIKNLSDNIYALDEIKKERETLKEKNKHLLNKDEKFLSSKEKDQLAEHHKVDHKIILKETAVKARREGEEIHKDKHVHVKEAKIRAHVEEKLHEIKNIKNVSRDIKFPIKKTASELNTINNKKDDSETSKQSNDIDRKVGQKSKRSNTELDNILKDSKVQKDLNNFFKNETNKDGSKSKMDDQKSLPHTKKGGKGF